MRGGYRPGSGRKKGQKDTKPRKGTEARAEAEKVKAVVALAQKAKVRIHQEFLIRIANQDKKQTPLSLAEKKEFLRLSAELAAETGEGKSKGEDEGLEPLAYMLRIMNDPNEDPEMRARMAVSAAPYIHPRVGEKQGKKDEKADRAKTAGSGKFAAGKPPVLKVVGK